ncbi:hypothetical protein AGDE_15534 [Angomonas deanei]|uniref:Uncharacterized protein n=1 Tax=Angomonas deanei TaxID=59799 RepID=A0A7G2CNS4_9TRYP|nr:hypothetical protein AGDE_15534 [Angomonas deanei]CAD2221516.1 hypothetical protein, conserved [Angomonas deanei]|eukprot:EPY18904.1 hypothetical protein AGDE_15534 [Angomonas deanei]
MTFPLQAGVQEAPLPAHGGRMTQLCISFDENTLYTSGADGTIIMWDIVSDDAGNQSADPIRSSDEVLVTQNELDDKQLELEVLQQQIDRLKNEIDGDEKRKSHEQRGRIREKEAEFQNDAAVRNEQYASLWNAKSAQERSFVAMKLEKEAEANQEVEMMEREYQAEVEELDGECRQMQETLDREVNEHAQKLESLRQQKKKELEEEEARFQDVLTQRNETLAKLKRQVERSAQTNKETLHQLELDTDAESQEVAGTHQAELNALRERYLHMKGEGAIMRKNTTRMEKEIEIRTNEIQFLDKAKSALSAQLVELGQRMTQLHQDIDERDGVIGEREKEIYNLKKQNQELEKHKFVLDHRIRQLKAQMEPKQREIAAQNQKINKKKRSWKNSTTIIKFCGRILTNCRKTLANSSTPPNNCRVR